MTADRQLVDETLRIMPLAVLLPPLGNVGLLNSIIPKLQSRYTELIELIDGAEERDADDRKAELGMLRTILQRLHAVPEEE